MARRRRPAENEPARDAPPRPRRTPRLSLSLGLLTVFATGCGVPTGETPLAPHARVFDPTRDLIALHFDHAPDKDDGQSAAADRTLLEAHFGREWIAEHALPISGTYGWLGCTFQEGSDAVMDAAWSDVGGWLSADSNWQDAATRAAARWREVLAAGGDVWVKEGGPSNFTAAVLDQLDLDPSEIVNRQDRIHVIQHATGNQVIGGFFPLRRVQAATDYRRIPGGNATLLALGGDAAFAAAARAHPVVGPVWRAAFEYYDPEFAIDFSDSAETYHILGIDEISLDSFRRRYLAPSPPSDAIR
jgi:hypothetical protein